MMFLCPGYQPDTEGATAKSGEFGDKVLSSFCKQFSGKMSVEPGQEGRLPSAENVVCGASGQELLPNVCLESAVGERGLKINFSSGCLKTQEHLQIQLPFPLTFLRFWPSLP